MQSNTDISGVKVENKVTEKKEEIKQPECRRCGYKGHYSIQCKITHNILGEKIEEEEGYHSDQYY